MKIEQLTLAEVTLELKRAKFWVEDTPIRKSLDLINKMETIKLKLINKSVDI
jgi:hypothetical protein